MPWNWELPDWPRFRYDDTQIAQKERLFLLKVGSACGVLKHVPEQDYKQFIVEILSSEGVESSRIEGEFLDRESLQSSIKRHFGIHVGTHTEREREKHKEKGMAQLLCDVYASFDRQLTHEMLWQWHNELFHAEQFASQPHLEVFGAYRTHPEPMQIVSSRYDSHRVFFEAPPSAQVPREMSQFVDWFNRTNTTESISQSVLSRAAIAHVYFESIHPFEDGNGRIGRVLVEKALSQGVGRPILIAISKVLERRKKEYYAALEMCNRTLEVGYWVEFFVDSVLQAQEESMKLLYFLVEKSKLLTAVKEQLNPRQEKALLRLFAEGPNGFKGGLSADNYISITKTSRATATRDLNDLVQKGALVKSGELRHTRYWLKSLYPLSLSIEI